MNASSSNSSVRYLLWKKQFSAFVVNALNGITFQDSLIFQKCFLGDITDLQIPFQFLQFGIFLNVVLCEELNKTLEMGFVISLQLVLLLLKVHCCH